MAECTPLNSSRPSIQLKEQYKREANERRRNLLYLINSYLIEHNLKETAKCLQKEAHINEEFEVCDNIDMEIILQEYQSYYQIKFHRQPKILKRNENSLQSIPVREKKVQSAPAKKAEPTPAIQVKNNFEFDIIPLSSQSSFGDGLRNLDITLNFSNESVEFREMAQQITKEIIPKNTGITFQDCIGLEQPIELLKEAIIYPSQYPELFQNLPQWQGILLYGPPGTGKTHLAKALACESGGNLINVTSSTFISKWRGESEKMVRVLFELAKTMNPTTIFIDEIDTLGSISRESNHEASRRFKTELLTQIDGIATNHNLFVLGTTNSPWNIDVALLRRFEKRILVPLPDNEGRKSILNHYLLKNNYKFSKQDLENVCDLTKNFSGADLKIICKELEMVLIREIIRQGASKKIEKRKPTLSDITKIIKKMKPSFDNYERYVEWSDKFGSV